MGCEHGCALQCIRGSGWLKNFSWEDLNGGILVCDYFILSYVTNLWLNKNRIVRLSVRKFAFSKIFAHNIRLR